MFTPQVNLSAGSIGAVGHSAPSAVQYGNTLYVFYNGFGNDGIYWTTLYGPGTVWTNVKNVKTNGASGMGVDEDTGPAAVVYREKIYLFYNGAGHDGTFYTTTQGSTWTSVVSLNKMVGGGFLPGTSPTATVFNDVLYVFYNGGGLDGTCEQIGQNYLDQTSPAVLTEGRGDRMVLFWVGSGNDGIFYTKFDGTNWASVTGMQGEIGAQGLFEGSSPGAAATGVSGSETKVFWLGLERGIFFSSSLSISADKTDTAKALEALDAGKSFVLYSQNSETVSYFQDLLTTDPETVPPGAQQPPAGFDVTGFYNWLFPRSLTAAEGTLALANFSVVLGASFLRKPAARQAMARSVPRLPPPILQAPVGAWAPNGVVFWMEIQLGPQQPPPEDG